MAIVTAASLFSSTVMAAPAHHGKNQFNLICSGQATDINFVTVESKNSTFKTEIVVNLDNRTWCWKDNCGAQSFIALDNAHMVLQDNTKSGDLVLMETEIQRSSGNYTNEITLMSHGERVDHSIETGTCEIAPYTGMPKSKF